MDQRTSAPEPSVDAIASTLSGFVHGLRLEDVPAAVSSALASGKVVVLLVAEKGADDAASSGHYGAVSRLGGVRAFRAGVEDLERYAGIVAQVGLSQAPAAVIVRPDLKAVPPIEGYVDSQYLLQRVKDQLP